MSMVDNLKSILAGQKEIQLRLETEITNIEANDLVTENQNLKSELLESNLFLEEQRKDS